MKRVPAIPFAFAALTQGHRRRPLWAIHEPRGRYRALRPPVEPTEEQPRRRSLAVPPPRVGLNLEPGQSGTKQLLEQYGHRLVCARYRRDPERRRRFNTVELIVAERSWHPEPRRAAPDRTVDLRIAFAGTEYRRRVKEAGSRWNLDHRAWQLPYERAVALGPTRRIMGHEDKRIPQEV